MFRRRKQSEELPPEDEIIEGEIQEESDDEPPLERVAPDIPTPEELSLAPFVRTYERPEKPARKRRLPKIKLPKILAWEEIRPEVLLMALALIGGGVFGTLYNRGQTSENANQLAPLILLIFAFIWSLYALVMRRPTTFLAATILVGISISFWLDMQDLIDWRETLVGTILMTVGVGIMARGLVLRGNPT